MTSYEESISMKMLGIFQSRTELVQKNLMDLIQKSLLSDTEIDICFMSFGSLSRREMFFHTDLDILIVSEESEEFTQSVILRFKKLATERFCSLDHFKKKKWKIHFDYLEICPFSQLSEVEQYTLRCDIFRNSFRDAQILFCGSGRILESIKNLKKRVETVPSMERNIIFKFPFLCYQKNTFRNNPLKRKGSRMLLFLNWFHKLMVYRKSHSHSQQATSNKEEEKPCYFLGLRDYKKYLDPNFQGEEWVHLMCFMRHLFLRRTLETGKSLGEEEEEDKVLRILSEEVRKERILDKYEITNISKLKNLLSICFDTLEGIGSKIAEFVKKTSQYHEEWKVIDELWEMSFDEKVRKCNDISFVRNVCEETSPRMEILMTVSIFTTKLEVLREIFRVVEQEMGYSFVALKISTNEAAEVELLQKIVSSTHIPQEYKERAIKRLKTNLT